MLLSSSLFQIYVLGSACSVHVVQKRVERHDAVSLQPQPVQPPPCPVLVCGSGLPARFFSDVFPSKLHSATMLSFLCQEGTDCTGSNELVDSAGTKPPSVPTRPSCRPHEHRSISEPRSSLRPWLALTPAGWLKASLCPATTPTQRHRLCSSRHTGHAGHRLLPEHNTAGSRAPSAPRTRERARYEAPG